MFDWQLMEPVQKALNFTKKDIRMFRNSIAKLLAVPDDEKHTIDFLIIYYLADAIVSRQFEGLPLSYDFSPIEQFLIDNA